MLEQRLQQGSSLRVATRRCELGRDADTGGQTKYVVELAKALGDHPEVAQVDLFTRLIEDERVSKDYAEPLEPLKKRRNVYFAQASYARGVLKGLEHHGLL
jgi:hypothetical protein